MHTTNLRKVGGSVMLAVPPALLDLLKLRAASPGAKVDIGIEDGRLIVAPRTRPSYSLDVYLWRSATRGPPPTPGIELGSTRSRSATNCCNAAREIWLVSLDPTAGHEQQGTRPVVIVSPARFNELTGTPVVLPITTGGSFGTQARVRGLARRRRHPDDLGGDPLRPVSRPRSCRPERETPRNHPGADHG